MIIAQFPGIMDTDIYLGILGECALPVMHMYFPDGDGIFQQDNDPKHISKVLKQFISGLKKAKIVTDDLTSDQVPSKYMGFCKYNKNGDLFNHYMLY
jgi:hypothetical protein